MLDCRGPLPRTAGGLYPASARQHGRATPKGLDERGLRRVQCAVARFELLSHVLFDTLKNVRVGFLLPGR